MKRIENTNGGPGRTRTSNQTVMSAVTLSETSIKPDVFRHANQRMFTIGCGQSLAKRWLDACVMALLGIMTLPRSYGET